MPHAPRAPDQPSYSVSVTDREQPSLFARGEKLADRSGVMAEESSQHGDRRHEVRAKNGPRLEGLEQPGSQYLDGREGRNLEATEEHEDCEEHVAVIVGESEESGCGQAEDNEDQDV